MSYFEKLIVSAIDCTFDLTFPIKRVNTFFFKYLSAIHFSFDFSESRRDKSKVYRVGLMINRLCLYLF